jgi:hypothetical protein
MRHTRGNKYVYLFERDWWKIMADDYKIIPSCLICYSAYERCILWEITSPPVG